jgi:hypothetical protein
MTLATTECRKPLYSPHQVSVAAFIGSPLAAAWFLRLDFLALGDPRRAAQMIYRGVAFTVVVLTIAYFLPENFPNVAFPFFYSLAISLYAKSIFDLPYRAHIEAGGDKGSWWTVLGVSSLVSIAILAVVFAVLYGLAWIGILH